MDITQYAAKPESYDRLSSAQTWNFFKTHSSITENDCNALATAILDSPVSPTPVQGATSYTVAAAHVGKVVQFRTCKLDMETVELARCSYGAFVPGCVERGVLGTAYVYVWDFVRGVAFCRVRGRGLARGREAWLQQTVEDFARFFASAWVNQRVVEPQPGLLDKYSKTLGALSHSLPQRFQQKINEIRRSLPLLFRPEYPMVLQHDDLLENNIHVAEDIGQITGIVDWQDAMIAPFGVSIAGLETVLGVQTASTWYLHHDHVRLRKQFWDTFYAEVGEVKEVDRRSMEVARLFGLFRLHGFEENAAAYLDVLVLDC